MTFAKILKHLRASKGISQAALADILGVTQQAVGKWECDKTTPDYTILLNISLYFHVSTDYLLGRTTSPNATSVVADPHDTITPDEMKLIQKYRTLDSRGKRSVDYTLDKEMGLNHTPNENIEQEAI